MTYVLFIDDERFPVDSSNVVARSSSRAIEVVKELGVPRHICFDHDLGGSDTSMFFCRWFADHLIETSYQGEISWSVHSQNPVGAENIHSYMKSLIRCLKEI